LQQSVQSPVRVSIYEQNTDEYILYICVYFIRYTREMFTPSLGIGLIVHIRTVNKPEPKSA